MINLPAGAIYINNLGNELMIIDIEDYDEFLYECGYIFNHHKSVDKIIYKDNERYYEIIKEEFEEIDL